jgi:ADP-ribose pyrophosphatase YjhB (NUDIX family)
MKDEWYEKCFYRVSIKALIRNDTGHILMVSEKGSDYSLPGGGWDFGESLHGCLVRELEEEIALQSGFTEKVIGTIPFHNLNKDSWMMWIVCELSYSELDYGIGADGDDVKWVSEDEIDNSTVAGQLIQQVLEQ